MTLQISIVPQLTPTTLPPARPPLWMHLEDRAVFGSIRSCAPCPAVFVLLSDPHTQIGEQWQYYLRAINYNMTVPNVYLLLDDHLAFANNTGFPALDNPGDRADFFFRRNLTAKPPALDKVRTCSRSVLTGTEAYSLVQSFQEVILVARSVRKKSLIGSARQAFVQAATAANVLQVQTFDSRQNPPLKPGRIYPSKLEDVRLDDYAFLPQTHPWMFATANIVNRAGEVVQFPRGALYSWTGDQTTRSFMPHISNPSYGAVRYPLSKLRRLGATEPIPSPYRSN